MDADERLAVVETLLGGVGQRLDEQHEEWQRIRERVHGLEKTAAGLLELQKQLHRANEWRIKRMTVAIGFGSLAIALGMLALAIATYLHHTH